MCVTIIEGYLRAAKRHQKLIQIQWKDKFFWSVFFTVLFWDCRSTKLLRLFSSNLPSMFGDLYLWCEGQFLQVEHTPPLPSCCPNPPPPPPPWLLTNYQSLKTRNFIPIFSIFPSFLKICHFLSFFSLRCQGTSSRVLNRLLHSFLW